MRSSTLVPIFPILANAVSYYPFSNSTSLTMTAHCSGREMRDDFHTNSLDQAIKAMKSECEEPDIHYVILHDNRAFWEYGNKMVYWCNYSPMDIQCNEALYRNASAQIDAACGGITWGGWVYFDERENQFQVSVGRDPAGTWECYGKKR